MNLEHFVQTIDVASLLTPAPLLVEKGAALGYCHVFPMTFCGSFNQVYGFNARISVRGSLTLTLSPRRAEGSGWLAML